MITPDQIKVIKRPDTTKGVVNVDGLDYILPIAVCNRLNYLQKVVSGLVDNLAETEQKQETKKLKD